MKVFHTYWERHYVILANSFEDAENKLEREGINLEQFQNTADLDEIGGEGAANLVVEGTDVVTILH